jgi:hypothetical protein
MLITAKFAWAHMGKTGGDATQQMLEAVPGLVEWAHSPDSNAKHDPFVRHAEAISGRLRVMNIRRLPAWILSMAYHRRTHGPWPDDQPHYMPTADEMAANLDGDNVLRYMSDGPRFPVERWLRQENLADDVAALLDQLGRLTEAARQAIASVAYRAKAYDHDLESWFTDEHIRTMYRLNPGWAEVERKVYGDLYGLAESPPAAPRRPRSIAARLTRLPRLTRPDAAPPWASEDAVTPARSRADDRDEIDIGGWLEAFAGPRLDAIDRQLQSEGGSLFNYRLFRDLDIWAWTLLLSRRYTSYLSILETLPHVPEPELQESRDGAHGLTLLGRSSSFYRYLHSMHASHGSGELPTARILDLGCGWGRLTRFFCRDVDPGCLHACEPDEELLQVCRRSHLPAVLHQTDRPPEGNFDLAYSTSALTRSSSEKSLATTLAALHESLNPGGLLVLTIPPPARPGRGDEPDEAPFGLPYLRAHWGDRFELVDVTVPVDDLYSVAVTLRRT